VDEADVRFFGGSVRHAASQVYRETYDREYAWDDLLQEAWSIALDRHRAWNGQRALAKADLKMRLRRMVRDRRYANGWSQRVAPDGRRWNRVTEYPRDPEWFGRTLAGQPELEDDDDLGLRLMAEWEPMGRSQRRRYARLLRANHPQLVREAEDLDARAKPRNISRREHERRQEGRRARFRVRWARELAETRFLVGGYGELDAA
jgi:hypothetical protein